MKPTSICLVNKALLTATLLLSLASSVQGDWWQKGRELLRNVAPATETSSGLSSQQVGAVQSYDAVMDRYRNLPLVPDIKADLTEHVVDQGMEGIFHYLAREEAAIRQNPVKRTTELLQQVFGAR